MITVDESYRSEFLASEQKDVPIKSYMGNLNNPT